ncbi:MAG TPA: type I secretion C-terminal target domain-containing protein, partial [Steroidobacteraceae bacterium]
FTIAATTGAAGSHVTLSTGSGHHLADINAALNTGFTYNPGDDQPQTDSVTLTVTDTTLGDTDTVHFIFNQGGEGRAVTLNGTSGKDIIFSTGKTDTLTGGAGADQFVFKLNTGHDTITDFAPGQDHIDLRAFSEANTSNINQWLGDGTTVVQQGADTLIHLHGNDSILLSNVAKANLSAHDFILHVT